MEQVVDTSPIVLGYAALLGLCVAYFHCLGPEVGVFGKLFRWKVVNRGGGFGESF